MDTVKCWLKGIESDQGYQNYLFYNGHFNTEMGNATLFHQGTGVVNTVGAMNGYRYVVVVVVAVVVMTVVVVIVVVVIIVLIMVV